MTTDDINRRKCEQIKNCIDSYLSKNSSLSITNVVEKTTVPKTTLRRIIGAKSNPQSETTIKIFNGLGEDELLYRYMEEFHPDIAKVMTVNFSHNQDHKFVDTKSRQYYTDENYFLILSLAGTSSGTTDDEVSYELGMRGIERLKELVNEGLLTLDTKGVYKTTNNKYKLSFADTKQRINYALKYYKLEEAGSINNWMSFQTESLNDEGVKALKKQNQRHFQEREDQILYNPMYNGNRKVYIANVSSTFLSYTEKGDLQ